MIGILTLYLSLALGADYKCKVPVPSSQHELSYKSLIELIDKKKIKTIDDLVPELGNHADYFAACGDGESAQAKLADLQHPRIISYGKSANLFIGYTSCAKDPKINEPYPLCETLEVIYRDPDTGAATLREVKLAGASSEKVKAMESEVNPQRCIHCHGNPPLPIFEAYNLWPGCYGSISGGGEDRISKDSMEGKAYLKWKKSSNTKGAIARYSKLHWENRKDIDFGPDPKNKSIKRKGIAPSHSVVADPNALLTDKAGEMTSSSLVHYFMNHPDYEYFKFTLAGALFCHDGSSSSDPLYADFFPKEMDKGHTEFIETAKSRFRKEVQRVTKKVNAVNPDFFMPSHAYYDLVSFSSAIMEIDYLFSILDIKSPRLTISQEQKYNASVKSAFTPMLRKDFLKSTSYCDSDLWSLLPEKKTDSAADCAKIASKSRASLLKWRDRQKEQVKNEKKDGQTR